MLKLVYDLGELNEDLCRHIRSHVDVSENIDMKICPGNIKKEHRTNCNINVGNWSLGVAEFQYQQGWLAKEANT